MKLSTKILITLGAMFTLGLLGVIVYQQFELRHQQDAIEQQVVLQKQLSDQLMRSQSQYATTKDIEKFIKDNNLSLKDIKDDLSKLHAEVSSVNKVVVNSNGVVATNVASTGTGQTNPTPVSTPDPFGFMKNEQKLTLNEPFGSVQVPIGSIGFSAWQEKPWSINVLPREYVLNTVVGIDENQRQYFYNKFVIKVDGKSYSLPITQAKTEQVYPTAKFSFWNPRLFLGMDGGVNVTSLRGEFVPNVGVGVMSYGKYLNQPTFSILQLGIGYGMNSKSLQFLLTPFAYNIGDNIPLMNNTYLGPSVMLAPNGNFSVMAGIRVGL